MTKKTRNRIALSCLIMFIVVWFFSGKMHIVYSGVGARAWRIQGCILDYIRENEGKFPSNEADLEQKYILKKTIVDDTIKYYVRSNDYDAEHPEAGKTWKEIALTFDLFELRYWSKLEKIERIDDKLYDKFTGKQILLIKGPYPRLLKNTYELISLSWYELILQEKEEHKGKPRII